MCTCMSNIYFLVGSILIETKWWTTTGIQQLLHSMASKLVPYRFLPSFTAPDKPPNLLQPTGSHVFKHWFWLMPQLIQMHTLLL